MATTAPTAPPAWAEVIAANCPTCRTVVALEPRRFVRRDAGDGPSVLYRRWRGTCRSCQRRVLLLVEEFPAPERPEATP